jgi:hypothetical protein
MSKEHCKKLIPIRYSDLAAICERLEKMESGGWRLESLRMLAEFQRCEPRKVRYACELLDTARIVGNAIPAKSRDYIDLCEQAGWSLVSHYGPLHIFRSEDIDAPDIISDPVEKLQAIKRATLRTYLPMWIMILFPLVYFILFSSLLSPAILATQYPILLVAISGIFGIVIASMYTVDFVLWYMKAKRAVRGGLPIPYNDTKAVNRATMRDRILIIAILATPLLLSLPGAVNGNFAQIRGSIIYIAWIILFLVIKYFFDKRDRSPAKALLVATILSVTLVFLLTVAVIVMAVADLGRDTAPSVRITIDTRGEFLPSPNSIPVTLLDVNPASGECENRADGYNTFLAGFYQYSSKSVDRGEDRDYLAYDIYHSHLAWLRQSYVRDFGTDDPDIEYVWTEIDATSWGANEAFIASDERWGNTAFVIIYDDYVLVINSFYKDTDAAVINKYAEVFRGLLGN